MSQHKNGAKSGGYFVQQPLKGVVFHYHNVYVLQQGARWGLHIYLQNKCMQFSIHIEM